MPFILLVSYFFSLFLFIFFLLLFYVHMNAANNQCFFHRIFRFVYIANSRHFFHPSSFKRFDQFALRIPTMRKRNSFFSFIVVFVAGIYWRIDIEKKKTVLCTYQISETEVMQSPIFLCFFCHFIGSEFDFLKFSKLKLSTNPK